MSRYVIIGGSGFVGQELVRQLGAMQAELVVLDIAKPQNGSFEEQDITKLIGFKFRPDDIVVHLAANQYHDVVPRKNREQFFESVNTEGTRRILEKMAKDGASQMIFFSTDMVYGKPQFLPVTVEHPQNPFGFYGKSKKKAEDICREYREKGFKITVFRPRMIIGRGRLGILQKLFRLIELNLPVPTIGSGRNCYQMVSVIDCASAIIKAVEKGIPNRDYNLGSENPPQVRELLRSLIKAAGSHSVVVPTWGKAVKAVLGTMAKLHMEIMYKEQYMIADENYVIDINQTKEELGWEPRFDDTAMMIAAFEEYRSEKQNEAR